MNILSGSFDRLEEVPPGTMAEVRLHGDPVLVCNVDGVFYALQGNCPHRGAPLAHGALHGHTIVCPWHAWEFDCRTGKGDCGDLAVFTIHAANGGIHIHA